MVDAHESIRKRRDLGWSSRLRSLRLRGLATDRRVLYLVVGGISAAVYYTLFASVWLAAGGAIPYLLVALLANVTTAVLTYPLYRRVVWQAPEQGLRGFLRFYVVCLWGLGYALVGLPVLVEWVNTPVLLAQAVIVITSPVINYQMLRLWTFRHAQ